jgi:hypothetical protein
MSRFFKTVTKSRLDSLLGIFYLLIYFMHKTILCIAYIKINTIHLHHQSNFNQKSSIMKIKLILVCLFGTLVSMQAQTSVKTSLLENPGVLPEK